MMIMRYKEESHMKHMIVNRITAAVLMILMLLVPVLCAQAESSSLPSALTVMRPSAKSIW